ncbi:O-antigen ligase family protein [Liquorilactobacillus mali]|uniref:O-antigen ligase family protein n=1 Tax=Liquorilactobacillus mali TaxID=1618 RepID=UPI0002491695|nr:O-antigen ligase family protein [Liquorilactobacillus mali]QFQ74446.1 O-antigen ligase family protein [Liquorilactobacillus mali]
MEIIKKKYDSCFVAILFFLCTIFRIKMFEGTVAYLIGIFFFVFYFCFSMNDKRMFNDRKLLIPYFLFALILMITLIMGNDRFNSCVQLFYLFICYLAGNSFSWKEEELKSNLFFIRNFVLVSAIYGIYEHSIKYNIFAYNYTLMSGNLARYYWQFSQNNYRVASFFLHPIIFGIVLLLAFWITWFSREKKIMKIVINTLFFVNIIWTMSRSIWLGFLASFIFYLIYYVNTKKNFRTFFISLKQVIWTIVLGFLTIVVIFTLLHLYAATVIERFSDVGTDNSYLQRVGTAQYFMDYFLNIKNFFLTVLGHGQNSANKFMLTLHVVADNFSTTDNQYLSNIYNYGLFVNVVVTYQVILAFLNSSKRSNFYRFICVIMFGVLIAMYFFEILDFITLNWLFIFLLGYLLSSKKKVIN